MKFVNESKKKIILSGGIFLPYILSRIPTVLLIMCLGFCFSIYGPNNDIFGGEETHFSH